MKLLRELIKDNKIVLKRFNEPLPDSTRSNKILLNTVKPRKKYFSRSFLKAGEKEEYKEGLLKILQDLYKLVVQFGKILR